ncbi:hypothetical protein C4D60_Mb10t03700 [Musa balbisiana]|uniref:Initiator tRNA phosphoribosyl transferase family protein n=1 Tax=Musa balbisiana TaxID=52838 RepID=A0A4S8IUE8_MUSBA|nr:hypothetical protein C4D60_Mb10t03700 [Musa balbisiana]
MAAEERMSVYRASRSIKRMDNSLYNALRSIYEDSTFVAEIAGLWPSLPLVANLRCGLWYAPRFEATCYFKSTDGHTNNWCFSTSRLNLHLARLAGQRGGCLIVDSTRKGKRFPDSMSKTIPIWACVINCAIKNYLQRMLGDNHQGQELNLSLESYLATSWFRALIFFKESNISSNETSDMRLKSADWDCSLHLPIWVSNSEKAIIETHLREWTMLLEACGADIGSLASNLRKPLRPLWISQKTLIWLNEIPDHDSWEFIPLILVSASASDGISQSRTSSGFSWHYIPGAGDDEESWARGLSADLFWKHAFELIDAGPELCNRQVAEIVEKERVYLAQRGKHCPQVTLKTGKSSTINHPISLEEPNIVIFNASDDVDCVLNCDSNSGSFSFPSASSQLHLPIVTSKVDRFSLIRNLPSAIDFAKLNLSRGRKLLVCCHNGEDISVCVCLAILMSLFDEKDINYGFILLKYVDYEDVKLCGCLLQVYVTIEVHVLYQISRVAFRILASNLSHFSSITSSTGSFDCGNSFMHTMITKWDVRRRLVFICKFATSARPSRGNLKQVFGFLSREQESAIIAESALDAT